MVNYITKKEFESISDDYKTTIKDTINVEVNYFGKTKKEVEKIFTDNGYNKNDVMIMKFGKLVPYKIID